MRPGDRGASPTVQRLGPAVLLQGSALLEVLSLVTIGARERSRRDGMVLSSRVHDLIAELAEAASVTPASAAGHADVPESASSVEYVDVGCTHAAELLDLSPRQVRRLASSIGGRKVAGALIFDRAAVLAYAALRREDRQA